MVTDTDGTLIPADGPTWDDFRKGDPIFDSLNEIGRFRLFAHISPLMELENDSKFQMAASKVYAVLAEAVGNAGFYRAHEIEVRTTANRTMSFVYQDDMFDFAVTIRDGSITIDRDGSTFQAFHEWYKRIGPHFWDMVSKITEALTDATGRKVQISRAYFSYQFFLIDLWTGPGAGRRVQNSEVMGRLLRGLPDDNGQLSEDPSVLNSASRVDVTFSRRLYEGQREWIERYELQAPANRDGERIDCDFSYQGETTGRGPGNVRSEFNPKDFIERYDTAYGKFLRDRVITAFLKTLMKDYSFRSVRSLG